tara:strand:+ start:8495 stop:8860 length:366 start_codon:yes stop_codon:yes gene_type:complete
MNNLYNPLIPIEKRIKDIGVYYPDYNIKKVKNIEDSIIEIGTLLRVFYKNTWYIVPFIYKYTMPKEQAHIDQHYIKLYTKFIKEAYICLQCVIPTETLSIICPFQHTEAERLKKKIHIRYG